VKGFASGVLDAETFLEAVADYSSPQLAGLTRSHIDLLKSILPHQRALDGADLGDLVAQFPFPVMRVNFFGRFIAGGCDDPRKAVRYLPLSTPFFVRVRSLVEGLSNDRFRFLVIQGITAAKEYAPADTEEEADPPPEGRQGAQGKAGPPALDKQA